MNGIDVKHDPSTASWVCHIETFSDDLKELIRENLSAICHGGDKFNRNKDLYSYKKTLAEFIKRYERKTEDIKKGVNFKRCGN